MGEYKLSVPVHTSSLISQGCISGCVRLANIDEYHKMVPCAIGHDTESRPQLDMCSSDSWRIMAYDVMKHKSKAWVRLDNFRGKDAPFMKIAFQTKESIWRRSHGETMDFMCFSKGFHSTTFRDIIIKCFNWIITKWRTQSHSCSWAIQLKAPLKIQYNNFEHTTTVYNIYNVSRSYQLIRHWGRTQRADISQTTFSYTLRQK